jgi:serine/threonine-protein kinase
MDRLAADERGRAGAAELATFVAVQGGSGMAKADRAGTAETRVPAAGALVATVAIAAISGLWSLFQWTELAAARAGAEVFCGFGSAAGGSSQCAQAWTTPFAVFVQSVTGLPVAGWGLVWSAAALALPLGALARRANGRPHEPLWSATLLTALTGVVASMGLALVLLVSGHLCATCVLTYALVLAYAAVCLSQGVRLAAVAPGAGLAAGAAAAAFAVLLVPGLRTAGVPPARSPTRWPGGSRVRRRPCARRAP